MFYEQDYIMRMIHELVRTLLKLLFHIDSVSDVSQQFDNEVEQAQYEQLLRLVDEGKINEAENMLFSVLSNYGKDNYKLALLFYDYLNRFDDDYLNKYDFSRDEIELGIKETAKICGCFELVDCFFPQST